MGCLSSALCPSIRPGRARGSRSIRRGFEQSEKSWDARGTNAATRRRISRAWSAGVKDSVPHSIHSSYPWSLPPSASRRLRAHTLFRSSEGVLSVRRADRAARLREFLRSSWLRSCPTRDDRRVCRWQTRGNRSRAVVRAGGCCVRRRQTQACACWHGLSRSRLS